MKYQIEVTQEDIDKGVAGSNVSCPIALAMRRSCKPEVRVGVLNFWVGQYYRLLPPEAQNFAEDFDFRRKVTPFTFEVEIPEATE